MNGNDERIGAALRDIAEQATPPRLDAGVMWRAGRRRRWAALTASAGSVAAAAALVPVILLGVLAGPAQPVKLKQFPPAALAHPAIEFGQLAKVTHQACLPGTHGLPGTSGHVCYQLTGDRMTARIQSARVAKVSSGTNGFEIYASLMPVYWPRFRELTAGLVHQHSPRNRLAIIAHGTVLLSPAVDGALPGSFELRTASGTRAAATHLLRWLERH